MSAAGQSISGKRSPTSATKDLDFKRLIIAVSIGNAMEWYDIIVYGYFALYLSKTFFPAGDAATSLLLTFGTFGISYAIRPIGGVVLGTYADRHGRKASLMLSIVMMTFGTVAIALMPGYETIGVLAPVAIRLARLVQGFSAGGEFGSSTAFLVEHAPNRRGFIASWQFASQGLSTLLASLFGVGLVYALTSEQVQSWGWRLPFFFGVLVGPVGIYIRNHLEDATAPPAAAEHVSPVQDVLRRQKLNIVLAIGALAISTAVSYLLVYMPTYAVKTLHLPASAGFLATFSGAVVLTLLTPLAGIMSDRIGRIRYMLAIAAPLLISIFPVFQMLDRNPSVAVIIGAVLWLAILKSLYYGSLAALMSELFPAASRATGLGLSYNIGVTLFGGMGPVIMAWLGGFIGGLAPAYYLTFVCILSIAALGTIRWRTGMR
jgi:MFS transporter, MHS family, proline/betaine transporter